MTDLANDMTATSVLVFAGCVLALATGCGDGGVSVARSTAADHRASLIKTVSADVEKVERIGSWNGRDDVLTAWLKVTRKEGAPYVVCIAVDIAGPPPVDAEHLRLVLTTPPESACKGTKPEP